MKKLFILHQTMTCGRVQNMIPIEKEEHVSGMIFNIPKHFVYKDLQQLMKSFGVFRMTILKNHTTGQSKGMLVFTCQNNT